MAIQKIQPSYKFNEEQLKQLSEIAPEVFNDNMLNFNALYEALADNISEDEFETEHYSLNWPGKTLAKRLAASPAKVSLIPMFPDYNQNESSGNIFIEGENMEALKLLQKAYGGRIKLIYIDPPYNTGRDFIYDDDFTESAEEYLKRTGQLDDNGALSTSNPKTDGRFHSKWLTMMYPRLKIARELLTDDGVMFISIDDNEVHDLILICNEIFGESNVEHYVWDVREDGTMPKTAKDTVRKEHEYIIAAFKDSSVMRLSKYTSFKYTEGQDWENPDNDPRGPWMSANMSRGVGKGTGGKKSFIITNPAGIQFDRNWAIDKDEYEALLKDNRIYFANNGRGVPRKKIFQNEPIESIQSSIFENLKSSQYGKNEIKSLIGDVDFDYPKPTTLLKRIIQVSSKSDDIILDFFAGSCTLAHAVYDLNKDEKTQRKFICIQIPEATKSDSKSYQLGFKTIAQLGLARIEKASQKIRTEGDNINGLDFGCKAYKLSHSNFRKWQNFNGNDIKQLETLFSQHESSLVDDWKPENLLTEILLIEGFPLDSKIEAVESFKKNKVQKVTSDFCEHALFVCLDKKVVDETIKALSLGDNDIFICLDNAVTDQDKARLDDKGLIKTI